MGKSFSWNSQVLLMQTFEWCYVNVDRRQYGYRWFGSHYENTKMYKNKMLRDPLLTPNSFSFLYFSVSFNDISTHPDPQAKNQRICLDSWLRFNQFCLFKGLNVSWILWLFSTPDWTGYCKTLLTGFLSKSGKCPFYTYSFTWKHCFLERPDSSFKRTIVLDCQLTCTLLIFLPSSLIITLSFILLVSPRMEMISPLAQKWNGSQRWGKI